MQRLEQRRDELLARQAERAELADAGDLGGVLHGVDPRSGSMRVRSVA